MSYVTDIINFNVVPRKMEVNTVVTFNGQIVNKSIPKPGYLDRSVLVFIRGSQDWAQVYTDDRGFFNGQFTSPASRGTYDVYADFLGGGSLLPSKSFSLPIMVGEGFIPGAPDITTVLILALIAVGIFGLGVGKGLE